MIKINASNLFGLIETTKFVNASNFTVNVSDGTGVGNSLIHQVKLNISNSSLPVKNSTFNGQINLYFYIKEVPFISSTDQDYQTKVPWDITFVLVAVSIRKRKLRKKPNKILSDRELLDLDLILKEKYNTNVKELLEEAEEKEIIKEFEIKSEIKIPLNIFGLELSPAEALCKYLRENKKMKFSEISRLINRDERTVWNNYNNAVKKLPEKIKEEKKADKTILVYVSIFADRRLSILESAVRYLKEKEYRNYEIAGILGKDQKEYLYYL